MSSLSRSPSRCSRPPPRAQDASLTVYLKNSGVGNFGQTNSLSSQVHVFAQSGFQAQYNGSTNIYAPAFGTAAPGSNFSVTVPNLTSTAKQSFNNYFLNLDWPDTQHHNVQLGPFKVAPGNNSYGAGGLGSVTPIDVANLAPPAVTNPMCYADQPSPSHVALHLLELRLAEPLRGLQRH